MTDTTGITPLYMVGSKADLGTLGGTLCGSITRGWGLHGDVGRLALHCVAVGLVLCGGETYVA